MAFPRLPIYKSKGLEVAAMQHNQHMTETAAQLKPPSTPATPDNSPLPAQPNKIYAAEQKLKETAAHLLSPAIDSAAADHKALLQKAHSFDTLEDSFKKKKPVHSTGSAPDTSLLPQKTESYWCCCPFWKKTPKPPAAEISSNVKVDYRSING